MTERNPMKRLAMEEVMNHPWMLGPVCEKTELFEALKDKLDLSH